ncbi:MAG: ABC transporter [Phycisphaerae bacterium]|nr:ABC transporter [Phycisphaerae bacterium]
MANETNQYERGSEWRQWDLHIHSPASFHWTGQSFDPDPNSLTNKTLVDEMINALNAAEPAVFALMDYWTFDGWFALKRRLAEPDSPKLTKTVFPGIELRLVAPMTGRLNAHVIFSNTIEDQMLHDFKSGLTIELIDRPLSVDALIALARMVGKDKLEIHGFNKVIVDSDRKIALIAGATIAEINCESYKDAIAKVPDGLAIGFMPYDTSDGLAEVKWQVHYAYYLGLFKSSPIFETRKLDTWNAFVGHKTNENSRWIDKFQLALDNIPRLAVSGSDAHCFTGSKGNNDNRGYGDFPSGKVTWIKADPTFLGLQQAIMEPKKRSFIGECPPKLYEIRQNKTYFIDSVTAQKKDDAPSHIHDWLDNCNLLLSPDLIAIIGNKGSGKSALADIIALLGNSKQNAHFSFLKKDRFRGKTGDPARYFDGTLTWHNADKERRNLNEDPPAEKSELVRYIPQGHFEALCNDHVSGKSDAFENELREVIFSHAGKDVRLGALDFSQLIEKQESSSRDKLSEFREELRKLNQDISRIEDQQQPEVANALKDKLIIKNTEIEEHQKEKPTVESKPTGELTPEQQVTASVLAEISEKLKGIDVKLTANLNKGSLLAGKLKAIKNVRERMEALNRSLRQFQENIVDDLKLLDIAVDDFAIINIKDTKLNQLTAEIPKELAELEAETESATKSKTQLIVRQTELNAKLEGPQLKYQKSLKDMDDWNSKLSKLTGTEDAPETQKGLRARILQLKSLPETLKEHIAHRLELTGGIFDILEAQKIGREGLYKPVQDLIQKNSLIREEYKLQFQAILGSSSDSIADDLFSIIKQNAGVFRGDAESYSAVRKIAEKYDFNKRDDILKFTTELHDEITKAAKGSNENAVGIKAILRKGKVANDVYDMLFGLSFLELRYSLLFQETQIEQLSPGQRGALLLIFYLLVDKGRNPIILDQPEENLDNETVVSLLAPVLSEAKKKRQIIMVTHNPNLAVYCDAEQVIYSCFNRSDSSKITYSAGSIENPETNKHVVDVLEGTMPAFNNRRIKYH